MFWVVPKVKALFCKAKDLFGLLRHTYAVPDLCCIVTRRLVESVGEVF